MSRLQRIRDQYGCSQADAQRFIDLRDEGYSITQAALMAGLADPHDPEAQKLGDSSDGCGEPVGGDDEDDQ